MNSQSPVNRVEAALREWHSREERFGKLFSFSLSSNKSLLKEKLGYYERISARYRETRDLEERFALRILKQERKRIEKQLYPNIWFRMLRRLLHVSIRDPIMVRKDNKKIAENRQSLQDQIRRSGFNGLEAKIGQYIKSGQSHFSIPVTSYLNERERVDHQLSFLKDATGAYRFDGYKTSLYNESKPQEKRQQSFHMETDQHIHATEAYHLLSGRAVYKNNVWIQLDFNDKDSHGNFRVKEFQSAYGYQLEQVLKQFPLKELCNDGDTEKILNRLKSGERIPVSFVKNSNDRNYFIEANPQFKSIDIYDQHARKVSLHAALKENTMETIKTTHKIQEKQERSQTKKNGIHMVY